MKKIFNMNYYTLEETSEMIGKSVRTLQRYVKDGKIEATKIGASILFTKEQITAFINK